MFIQSMQTHIQDINGSIPYLKAVLKYHKSTVGNIERDTGKEKFSFNDLIKFDGVSFLSSLAIASVLATLRALGLTEDQLRLATDWVTESKRVFLSFRSERQYSYLKEKKRSVSALSAPATGFLGFLPLLTTSTHVTDTVHSWSVSLSYSITLHSRDASVVICREARSFKVSTARKDDISTVFTSPPIDIDITWIFTPSKSGLPDCSIDTQSDECCSPRRNPTVNRLVNMMTSFCNGIQDVLSTLSQLSPSSVPIDLVTLKDAIFMPLIPYFRDQDPLWHLEMHRQSLHRELENMPKFSALPPPPSLPSENHARLLLILHHQFDLASQYLACVNYIERSIGNISFVFWESMSRRRIFLDMLDFINLSSLKRLIDQEISPI